MNDGHTCKTDYEPIISSWQDCKQAAESSDFTGDAVAHVEYVVESSGFPQGCYQSGLNARIHFNRGPGGGSVDGDKILCKQGWKSFLNVECYSML